MLNKLNSSIIAYAVYHFDRTCRDELSIGNITSERDYVSNLATHIRFPLGPFINLNIGYARSLESTLEQLFGCDSIIIFKKKNFVKVGLFEAKWPRYFTNKKYSWDNMNGPKSKYPNISRFNSQLLRQQNWKNSGAVIWEMFFNEQPSGHSTIPFDEFGSSCLFLHDAWDFKNSLSVKEWNNTHLTTALNKAVNLRRMVYNILRCNWGKKLNVTSNSVLLKGLERKIEVPILMDTANQENRLNSFFERTGIQNYISLNLDDLNLNK